jgi:hypothetical protein
MSGREDGLASSTETADGCYEQSRGDAERDSGGQTRKQPAPADRKARDKYRQSSHHSGNVGKGRGHFCYLWACLWLTANLNSKQANPKTKSGHQGSKQADT